MPMDSATGAVCADGTFMRPVLSALQERIGPQKFNAWFRHGARVSIESGHVRVAVPNLFVAKWIENHYQSDIGAAVQQCTGTPMDVIVSVDPSLTGAVRKTQLNSQAEIVHKAAEGRLRGVRWSSPPLRYRLEDFVVGKSNRLAHSAVTALADGGPCAFSHVFVHGACGVGKTHLLQGLCDMVLRAPRGGPPVHWRFVTGEQFTNEFVSAIRRNQGARFRARYRQLDLLAVDDVHFLSAKKGTQDELLHTFNAIQSAGKRVVLASDAHPRLVSQFNEQLVSRFMSGMVVKIEPPDEGLRLAILARRAAAMRLQAGTEVLRYIAMHIRGSVRELEGALFKLAAVAALHEGRVTIELANEALADHLARTESAITLGDIEAAVAAFFGLSPADMHSSRRTRTISVARRVAMFFARRHTRMSFPEIGRFMGKNHSSVVLAVQRMEQLLAQGQDLTWLTPAGTRTMPAAKVVEVLSEQFG